MLKLEHYDIAKNVHVFRQGGLNIAYDVPSGSLHLLDDKTAEYIQELSSRQKECTDKDVNLQSLLAEAGQRLSTEEKQEILTELADLQKANLLFSAEAHTINPTYPEEPLIKAMCLHVAHDCNLRCGYCFAGTGPFGGSRSLMSVETGRLALDYLLKHNGERKQCEVDFFGGEPLMNFAVVKKLISYGKTRAHELGKKMKFTLTTNGVLLDDEVAEYLEAEEVSVVLSIDGRKEVNDRMRPYSSGRGSYDKIMPQILNFVRKRPESSPYAVGKYYYVRGTYTRYNKDFHNDVLHLVDQGISRVSVEPVVAPPEADYAIREQDLPEIKASYDLLGEQVLAYRRAGKPFHFFHFNAGLDEGPCLPKRLSGCGAGHEYVAISPEGDIYPCHQFVGQEEYKLGSLYGADTQLKPANVQKFRQANVLAKQECQACWARFSCSGGCHAANVAASGSLTEVYAMGCELQKKRLEVAYYLKVKEAQERMESSV